jgi:hypothetical protein
MEHRSTELYRELGIARDFLVELELSEWLNAIGHHLELLKSSDYSKVMFLWNVFAPTCGWDDLCTSTKSDSERVRLTTIGESVFREVDRLVKELKIDPAEWNKENA